MPLVWGSKHCWVKTVVCFERIVWAMGSHILSVSSLSASSIMTNIFSMASLRKSLLFAFQSPYCLVRYFVHEYMFCDRWCCFMTFVVHPLPHPRKEPVIFITAKLYLWPFSPRKSVNQGLAKSPVNGDLASHGLISSVKGTPDNIWNSSLALPNTVPPLSTFQANRWGWYLPTVL